MRPVLCPKCRKLTFHVNRIYTPFPKSLRQVRRDAVCIYCGALLRSEGGSYTPHGKMLILAAIAVALGIAIYFLQRFKSEMPLIYGISIMFEALVVVQLGEIVSTNFNRKNHPPS